MERDWAGERDASADERDLAGERRDEKAERRDRAGDQRDEAAEGRDEADHHAGVRADDRVAAASALERAAAARTKAASDRRDASQDRVAGASDRSDAGLDRRAALADRMASARDREDASRDDLTGTYLRGAGFGELDREIARARRTDQPLVVAFVDVDNLKTINDSHGHAAGDQMLVDVANTFRAKLRPYDLVIRFGGDEFICAIAGLDVAGVSRRFALVNAALTEAPAPGSVTVGLAELQPDDSTEDLVARADAALYGERQQHRGADV